MNEEELAGLLDEYLDRFLGGEGPVNDAPAELTDLLGVAQNLTAVAPMPRPEFTTALRASVLASTIGAAGSAGTVATAVSSKLTLLVVAGVTILAAIALTIGTMVSREAPPTEQLVPSPSPTLLPAVIETTAATNTTEPEPPTSTTAPTATATEISPTPEPTSTSTETATPIIDEIPTVIVIDEVEPAIDLLPPEPTSTSTSTPTSTPLPIVDSNGDNGNDNPPNNDDPGQEEGGNDEGDHDRGHGNDDDHNDEDNPGKGGGKKK